MNTATSSKRTVVFPPQAAGSTVLTSGVLDMQGFNSVIFETLIGALTTGQVKGVISVNAGNLSNGSDMAPLGGATITINDTDTGKLEVIEIVKPTAFRYLQLVITRNAQAAAISSVVATAYGAHRGPTSDDPTTVAQTVVVIDPEYVNTALTPAALTYPTTTTTIVSTTRTSS